MEQLKGFIYPQSKTNINEKSSQSIDNQKTEDKVKLWKSQNYNDFFKNFYFIIPNQIKLLKI